MQYGHFDDDNKEYVITQPDTPLPWINYLGNESYFGLISNTAGGYSFYKDARLLRLTRYRYNNAPLDMGGRYIYLRDQSQELKEPCFWSPTWMPTRVRLDNFVCRHGLGYTKIISSFAGIESQIRYFVPLNDNLEIWELTLTNNREKTASLSAFSAIEFCLWDAMDDATNFQRNYSIGEVEIDPPTVPNHTVIYHKTEYRERRNHFAFFACSEPIVGYDTNREAFLGPYRGWDSPMTVEAGKASNSTAFGWQPIGAHQVDISIKPSENKKLIFILGYHENTPEQKFYPPSSQIINKESVKPLLSHYLNPSNIEQAFQDLQKHWNELLNKFQATTGDIHTNRMINIWNAYQVVITFYLSRSASYFESGISRGIGFRDSNQDLLGVVHLIPERARERILDLAATQLPDGGAYHQYQPLTKRGNNDIGSNFNDDPLWLVLSTAAYIKETGDCSILEESIPYDFLPDTAEPLLGHLHRSIQYTLDRLGPHQLPLIGRADWNDCLNLNCFSDSPGQSFQTTTNKDGGVAESIFIAGLFVLAAKEMSDLVEYYQGQAGTLPMDTIPPSRYYSEVASKMEDMIWDAGWDGSWFRRAYDSFGQVLGSQKNEQGRIFIEPQGICIMAGLGVKDGRALQALDATADHLATPHGLVLHQPAFNQYYLHLGEISSYPPGYKENAGIFCHTNPWIMIAETMIGRGDKAYDYYLRINPSKREEISDVHKTEPYVYSQMIAGKDAPTFGEAKNSWLTGTAAWNYVAITQWILGIRPSYHGLEIDPVIPTSWNEFHVTRIFRGTEYDIQIERIGVGNNLQIIVDGTALEGNIIPIPPVGTAKIKVKVLLGSE